MATAQLSVELSANISTLVSGLKTASQVIDAFGVKAYTGLNATDEKLRDLGDKTLKKLNNDLKVSQSYFQLFGDSFKNNANKLSAYQTALHSLLEAGFRPTSKEVLQLTEKITGLNKIIEQSKSPFSKLGQNSNTAGFALTNLGRVAQDVPFGFIGIQNNLNPLLESFQRLRAEAGSNTGALKLLGQSLMGAGGVGLALSLVTAGLTLYTQYQQKAKSATKESVDAVKKAREELNEYIESLDAVTRAHINGTINAQKEVDAVRRLYEASRNLNLPMEERKRAAKELQEQYPKTFANFTAEEIALGKASKAYQQLAYDIRAVAKAAARTDIITQNEKEIVQGSEKIVQLDKQRKIQEAISKTNMDVIKNNAKLGQGAIGYANAAAKADENSKSITDEINNLNRAILEKKDQNLRLEKQMTDEMVKQKSVTSITGIDDGKGEKTKKELKSLGEILADLKIELQKNEQAFGDTFNEKRIHDIDSYQKAIDELVQNGFKPAGSEVKNLIAQQEKLAKLVRGNMLGDNGPSPKLAPNGISGEVKPILKMPEFKIPITNEEIKRIDDNNKFLESSFASLASSIGQSLAEGASPLAAFGKGVLSVIGDVITRFGTMTLAAGIAASALGKALRNPLNPINAGAAIAAGAALIAVGAAVKAFSSNVGKGSGSGSDGGSKNTRKSVPGFATGVNGFSGGFAVVGERGPELVNLPTGSSVVPTDRSMNMLNRNSNENVINLTGGVKLGARELVLFLDGERALMKRNGYKG